jgi:ribose 5-phosphate isomerase RpiB
MRVGIASDHGGFDLKGDLVARLNAAGHAALELQTTGQQGATARSKS